MESDPISTEKSNEILKSSQDITDFGNGMPIGTALKAGLIYGEEDPSLGAIILAVVGKELLDSGENVRLRRPTSEKSNQMIVDWKKSTDRGFGLAIATALGAGLVYTEDSSSMAAAILQGLVPEKSVVQV